MSYSAAQYFRVMFEIGHETPSKLLARCPFCHGSEAHPHPMALMLKSGYVICVRCGYGAKERGASKSIYDLAADVEGITVEEARRTILTRAARRVPLRGTVQESLQRSRPEPAPRVPAPWLKRFSPLEGPVAGVRRAILYLEQRGIGPEEIERYGIRLGRQEFLNRVMIPVIEKGDVLFFTGRSFFPKERLRYRDAVRAKDCPFGKDEVVFNLEAAARQGHLVLTEGPFDAIWTDISLRSHGVKAAAGSPFGKRSSEAQVARMVTSGIKRVTLMLDSVGVTEAEEQEYLSKLRPHFDTRVVWLPKEYKDPADTPGVFLAELIRGAVSVNNKVAYMAARLAGQGKRC